MLERLFKLSGAAWAMAVVGGCSISPPPRPPDPPRVSVPSGGYEGAFNAVKDEIRALGFRLARVDARHGVITSEPLVSAGFATPWTQVESSVEQEILGAMHRNRRRVEATITSADDAEDLRLSQGPFVVRIRVLEDRVYRFGVQAHPVSIRMTSVSSDPTLAAIGAEPLFAKVVGEDDRLARRIADRLRERLNSADAQARAGAAVEVMSKEGA